MGAHPVLVLGAYSLFRVLFLCCGCTLGCRRVGVHRRAQAWSAPCACHSPPLVAADSWDMKVPQFVLHPRDVSFIPRERMKDTDIKYRDAVY